jgi:hypothetical protein
VPKASCRLPRAPVVLGQHYWCWLSWARAGLLAQGGAVHLGMAVINSILMGGIDSSPWPWAADRIASVASSKQGLLRCECSSSGSAAGSCSAAWCLESEGSRRESRGKPKRTEVEFRCASRSSSAEKIASAKETQDQRFLAIPSRCDGVHGCAMLPPSKQQRVNPGTASAYTHVAAPPVVVAPPLGLASLCARVGTAKRLRMRRDWQAALPVRVASTST